MSWLTDPDEEWSSDEPAGSGHASARQPADPAAAQTAPQRAVPPEAYRQPGPPPAAAGPVSADAPTQYTAIPEGLWAQDAPGQRDAGWHEFADYGEDEPRRSRLGLIAAIVVGWLVVSIVVLAFLLLFQSPKSSHKSSTAGSAAPTTSSSAKQPSGSTSPGKLTMTLPAGWIQQAADDQTDCAAHSYGQIQAFFAKTPCVAVHRVLATTNQGGKQVIVAAYVIGFQTQQQAASFNTLVTGDGTGDIADLLREGKTFPGAPPRLPNTAFASHQSGTTVRVAEAGFTSGPSNPADSTLTSAASQAVSS